MGIVLQVGVFAMVDLLSSLPSKEAENMLEELQNIVKSTIMSKLESPDVRNGIYLPNLSRHLHSVGYPNHPFTLDDWAWSLTLLVIQELDGQNVHQMISQVLCGMCSTWTTSQKTPSDSESVSQLGANNMKWFDAGDEICFRWRGVCSIQCDRRYYEWHHHSKHLELVHLAYCLIKSGRL